MNNNFKILNFKKMVIMLLGMWLLFSTTIITLFLKNPVEKAVIKMVWGLIFLWIIVCGGLMYFFRNPIKNIVLKIPLPWYIKFVFFTIILAFIEEFIATTMTNMAPFFNVKIGDAYITASTNFWDVIFFHSLINFIGPFIFWAIVLKYYDFSPFSAFLIWGTTGILAEVLLGGPRHFLEFGLWMFVYGLMIFLPVYSIPSAEERKAKCPKFYHYFLMIFLPLLFVPLFAWIPLIIDPNHPQPTHFN